MQYEDKKIKCIDCGKDFIFSAGEQAFFAQKGFTREPIRCLECRKAKKSSFGKKPNQPQQQAVEEMHTITCKKCAKSVEIPFKPKFPDDIYCAECFETVANQPKK